MVALDLGAAEVERGQLDERRQARHVALDLGVVEVELGQLDERRQGDQLTWQREGLYQFKRVSCTNVGNMIEPSLACAQHPYPHPATLRSLPPGNLRTPPRPHVPVSPPHPLALSTRKASSSPSGATSPLMP